MRANTKQEHGAVAVLVAILSLVIFGVAALAVDLGNTYARKRAAQTQADMVALAAAAQLPKTSTNTPAIEAVLRQFSNKNEIPGQDPISWNWDLTDTDETDGYVEFDGLNKIRVYSPDAYVSYAFGQIFGTSGANVSAVAAAEVRSPGRGLPFFISQTCSWGSQTVLDATRGRPVPSTYEPTFVAPSPGLASPYMNSSKILSVSPNYVANGLLLPQEVMITTTSSNGLNGVDAIGFTTESGDHYPVPIPPTSGDTVALNVPTEVLSADDTLWWIRLHKSTPDRWSAPVDAKYFEVGDPVRVYDASCDSKNSGNFGSLNLSRDDVSGPAYWLEENLAEGIQHDLGAYPPPAPYPVACAGQSLAVTDPGAPDDSLTLNCLQTDSGSDLQQRATEAFIKGTRGGTPPRLGGTDHPTSTNCSPNKDSEEREVTISGTPYKINDDVLSCFIDAPGVTVGQISSDSSPPAGALSADIFTSPRFMWLPVLVDDPSRGTSGSYAIVGMRPAFITEQDDSATKDNPMATPSNGVEMSSNGIEKMRVRAIHPLALPEFAGVVTGGTIPYIGVGTKVVELVE